MTSWLREGPRPGEDGWVAAIHRSEDDQAPLGSGFLVDGNRVLTCAHVACEGGKPISELWVAFPKSEQLMHQRIRVAQVVVPEEGRQRRDDVAVLVLYEKVPDELAARVRQPGPGDLVGQEWWSFGFPSGDEFGNSARGQIGEALSYGWVRLDTHSPSLVTHGYSGAALWSVAYQAVVGIVGQANKDGDARALTLWQADRCLPREKIALLSGWSAEAAGESALAAWGWSLTTDPEAGRHWRPRARGVSSDAELGFRFRGRTAALTEIVAFISAERAARRTLIVTGSPGVGKSAVLGRVVTSADPEISTLIPASDTAVRSPVGSVACAVHAKGKSALEIAGEIARAASATLPKEPSDLAPALRVALTNRHGAQFAVVIDALDEAASPEEARIAARQIVRPLAEDCADLGVRVVIGTRRHDDGGDLLSVFGPATIVVDLDEPEYFAQADLTAYALASLQLLGAERPQSPYAAKNSALPVAKRIATLSARNFLVAGLIARARGLYDDEAADPDQIVFTPTVDAALSEYVERIPTVGQRSALELLTALAYAQAPGFSAALWSTAIAALYGSGPDDERLRLFARSSAANFLVDNGTTDGGRGGAFRLFHQALNDVLLVRRAQLSADEWALTSAFIALGRSTGWRDAPAYLFRALPSHATHSALINKLLDDDEYLLYADLRRLIPATTNGGPIHDQDRIRLLRKTPRTLDADPATRAALLSVTEAQEKLGNAYRTLHLDTPYRALWAHVTPQDMETVLEGHTAAVNAVCMLRLHDGRVLLASGDDEGTVRLWDPAVGESIHTLREHTARITALCAIYMADGRTLLASGGDDARIRLWDPEAGELLRTLRLYESQAKIRALVPLSRRAGAVELVSGSDDGDVRLWDPDSGHWTETLAPHPRGIRALCLVPHGGGTDLACASDDGTVRLWDPTTKQERQTSQAHTRRINALCVVQLRESVLLATDADRAIRLWDPDAAGTQTVLRGHQEWVNALCTVPREEAQPLVASASSDRTVGLWEPDTGEMIRSLKGHQREVRAICALPLNDGRTLLATGSADKTVRLWDPATGATPDTVTGHAGIVTTACPVPTGDDILLATGGDDTTVRLWNPATSEATSVLNGHTDCVRATCTLTTRSGTTLLASAGHDRRVRIWNPVTGKAVASSPECTDKIGALCAITTRRDATLIATGHDDSTVQVWDPSTGQQLRTLQGHTDCINALCEVRCQNGTVLLASGSNDHTVRIWDPATGTAADVFRGHTDWVQALCTLPLGDQRTTLASGAADGTVRIWDLDSGHATHCLTGHTDWVYALCTLRLGERLLLVSGGDDRTVRVWDPESLREVLNIPVRHQVRSLTAIDGHLFVATTDGIMALAIGNI